MASTPSASSIGQRKSYREYINSMNSVYPESKLFQRLQDFFNRRPATSRCWTRVSIFDSINEEHRMKAPVFNAADLSLHLRAHDEAISARVVLVEFQAGERVERDVIDVLGSCYDIDPFIIDSYLARDEMLCLAKRPSLCPPSIEGTCLEQGAWKDGDKVYCFVCMVCYKAEDSLIDDVCPSIGLLILFLEYLPSLWFLIVHSSHLSQCEGRQCHRTYQMA